MNVSRLIWLACTVAGKVCARTYEKLHTTIDYNGMYDLIEMRDVQSSWEAVAVKDAGQDGN